MSDHESHTTTDHDEIRRWADERDAVPATVRGTQASDAPGVLTLDLVGHGAGEDDLEHIDWDAWFDRFEANELAFLYQDQKADGEPSTFFRLVSRSG